MPAAFWDSSALVPLFVLQGNTAKCFALQKSYDIITWWSSPVELASALGRLHRMKELDSAEYSRAAKAAVRMSNAITLVEPSEDLRESAVQLVGRYDLKAGDALQLAAALKWCEDKASGRPFITADDKLRDAATLCGFDTSKL